MAVASVIFTFVDEKGKTSSTKIHIQTGFTPTQYLTFASAAADIIKGVTSARIQEVSVAVDISLFEADLKTVATQFSDVFNKLLVIARDSLNNLFSRFSIPTYDDSNNAAGSDILDPVDAQAIALVALIEDGLDDGGIAIKPVNVRGYDLDEVVSATEKFRKS
jgi:hypothetical protein